MLSKRLARLEANRPALGASAPLDLSGLATDASARITAAMADGTFPQSLGDADLEAILHLADAVMGES